MKRHTTLLLLLVAVLAVSAPGVAEPAPTPPSGVTAIALDGKVSLAWPAVTGASGYRVYRGTSAATATTLVGSPTGASFVDTTAANGTTYFYAVTARDGTGESAKSASLAQAKPLARSCADRQRGRRRELHARQRRVEADERRPRLRQRHRGLRDRDERQRGLERRPQGQHRPDGRERSVPHRHLPDGLLRRLAGPPRLDPARPEGRQPAAAATAPTPPPASSTAATGRPRRRSRPRRTGPRACTGCASCATTTARTTRSSSSSAATATPATCSTRCRPRPTRPTTPTAASRSTTSTPTARRPSAARRAR